MNWLNSIEQSRIEEMFHKLAIELIEKDVLDNPRELTSEERAELGMALTVKWQNEIAGDLEEKLVTAYGTIKDNLDYSNWKADKGA